MRKQENKKEHIDTWKTNEGITLKFLGIRLQNCVPGILAMSISITDIFTM